MLQLAPVSPTYTNVHKECVVDMCKYYPPFWCQLQENSPCQITLILKNISRYRNHCEVSPLVVMGTSTSIHHMFTNPHPHQFTICLQTHNHNELGLQISSIRLTDIPQLAKTNNFNVYPLIHNSVRDYLLIVFYLRWYCF